MKNKDLDTKLKLALIVTSSQSAKAFLDGFARYSAMTGKEVFVIADGIQPLTLQLSEGVVHQVPIRMERDPNLVRDIRSLIELSFKLKSISPDVLIYGTPKASLLGSIAGALLRIPVRVYQIRGLRLETVSGPLRFVLAAMEKLTSRSSTSVLANSRSLQMKYKELGLNVGREVDLLGLGSSQGVDLSKYSKAKTTATLDAETENFLKTPTNRLVVGFVGRLHPDKGIETLFEAFAQVVERNPSARLLIVGGEEGAGFSLPGYLRNYVHFTGHISDTRPYYEAMNVLVLPSLREGFPNVVLEAAAMSVPSIVSDCTGAIDSVREGETGFIAPVGDAEAFARSIQKFGDDPDLSTEMGSHAREFVKENFGQEKVWRDMLGYAIDEN